MPSSLPIPAGATAKPVILLVEEYDALSVAIGSALQKFAPAHETRTVGSLSEAQTAAAEVAPELFVLDFDPPHARAIEFLQILREKYPDARALVIAAGTSAPLGNVRGRSGGLQFIEKPFDLAEFGAAIQALIGARTAEASEKLGTLRELGVADLVAIDCLAVANRVLKVTTPQGDAGEIHLAGGRIVHAVAGSREGIGALEALVDWPNARVETADAPKRRVNTIEGPWGKVLAEAMRKYQRAEPARAKPVVLPKTDVPTAKTGKKILVIDDTEMLLIFVEDILATAHPELQISTATTGGEGERRAAELQPDLILMDYSLPDVNGDMVCEHLGANKATAHIPIVMMSGHVLEMTNAAARLGNIVAAISKPFFSEQLLVLVEKMLLDPPKVVEKVAPLPMKQGQIQSVASPVKESPRPNGSGAKPAPTAVQIRAPKKAPEPAKTNGPGAPPSPAPGSEPAQLAPVTAPFEAPSRPATPPLAPVAQKVETHAVAPARIPSTRENQVTLRYLMEVVALELTPALRVGSMRLRSTNRDVSLETKPGPPQIGQGSGVFETHTVELDRAGHLRTIQLSPKSAAAIGTTKISPTAAPSAQFEFTPERARPVVMEMSLDFQLSAVELSISFKVEHLVLASRSAQAQVRLSGSASAERGTLFEIVKLTLDGSGALAEVALRAAD